MKAQRLVLLLLLLPLLSTVQFNHAGEVRKMAKIATIAYLMHKHLNPKGPAAYHISKPRSRSVMHEVSVDPSALVNNFWRKTDLVLSKMETAQRLLAALLRLLKLVDASSPERIVPTTAAIDEDTRAADRTANSVGTNLTQLLGLVQSANGDVDIEKVSHLLKLLQHRDRAPTAVPPSGDANTLKSSLLSDSW